jgi:hypothetical protein
VPTYSVGASLKVFSIQTTNFSSEAGEVLIFFAYFFASRQKSEWGLGQSPMFNYLIYNHLQNKIKFRHILRKMLQLINIIKKKIVNLQHIFT